MTFNRSKLRAGLILHVRTEGPFGRLIRHVLSHKGSACKRNHDALLVTDDFGTIVIGESKPPVSELTSLKDYEDRMAAGKLSLRVLQVVGATEHQERAAAMRWRREIQGKLYDYAAFPRLCFKALCMDFWEKAAGWEFAWYCTEGVRAAWINGGGIDPWRPKKGNCTPKTTQNRMIDSRVIAATLRDVTDEMMISPQGRSAGWADS